MISEFEWIDNNAHVTFGGDLSFTDINQADEKIFGDLRFDLMKYAIFDFSNIQKLNITKEEAQIIGILDRSSNIWYRSIRIALITTNIELMELSEIYRTNLIGSKWTVRIFIDFEAALKWCNS
jgi:hypothetical protein